MTLTQLNYVITIAETGSMNKAAELFLNECLEDKADYETAVAAWNEFEKSGKKGYSLEEVSKELGL